MAIDALASEGPCRRAAVRRTRRSRCTSGRRRTCSARWLTRSGAAAIRTAPSPTSSTATSTTRTCAWRGARSARSTGRSAREGGYVLGFEEIFRKIEETIELGGGQLLLQGGHNPDLPIDVVRGSVPRGEAALPGVQAARALVAGGAAHLEALAVAGAARSSAASWLRASTASPAAAPRSWSTACAGCCTATARPPPTSGWT